MADESFDDRYRTCPPGSSPGGLVFRAVDMATQEVISERAAAMGDPLEDWANDDGDVANERVRDGHEVRMFVYDGDSGECVMTVVVGP